MSRYSVCGWRASAPLRFTRRLGIATILIVDDVAANRTLLVTILSGEGHRLLEAPGGREALAIVKAECPDLVITDILMPGMDGYAFAKQLRLDPATSAIPVVFSTAHYGEREARAFAMSAGVSDVLTKPTESKEVLRIVGRLLSGQAAATPPAALLTTAIDREHLRLLNHALAEKAEDATAANARLRAMINIGLELASERDPDRVLHHMCEAARDLFGATYVTLGILDRHDRTVQQFLTCGADETQDAHTSDWIKSGDPLCGLLKHVVDERQTMRGDNPGGDPAGLQLPPHHHAVHAYLIVPLLSPTHVYGWICLVGNEGRSFEEDDEQLLLALSAQVGRMHENLSLLATAHTRAEALGHQVRERKHSEQALRLSEARMRFAMEAAGVGIWDIDFSTGVVQWSAILESQFGLAPGTFGGTFEKFVERVHPEDRDALLKRVHEHRQSGASFSIQHRALWADGTVRWLSGAGRLELGPDGQPVRGVGISLDVTERHTLEAQYQQAQKMEAIGQLAGGVAHDFNNLLTVILGFCELLLADLKPDDACQADVAEIQKAGARAAALTRQLLAFSRKEIIQPTVLDLNQIVTDIRVMLGRLIREDVTVVMDLGLALAPVKADSGQVEQVIMNLAVNARDAMPKGGTLTIRTANVTVDDHAAKRHLLPAPGSYVVLSVCDTGTGMTPAVKARLFEPFFTTKELGKGTGLGLATVRGIVARCGGGVSVDSEVGKGTSVMVYLPRAEAAAAIVAGALPAAPRARTGRQTILVVEDAAGLRELTKRLLNRHGYTVLLAASAEEAMRLFDDHPSIDLLLTDVVMPGASGPELVKQLAERRPGLKVIYMSGYVDEAIAHHGVLDAGIAFVHKPFSSETLARKIQEVLRPSDERMSA